MPSKRVDTDPKYRNHVLESILTVLGLVGGLYFALIGIENVGRGEQFPLFPFIWSGAGLLMIGLSLRRWFLVRKAAYFGGPILMLLVACMSMMAIIIYAPMLDNPAKSWHNLERKAANGDVHAMVELGKYLAGSSIGSDPVRARHWLNKAAELGHPEAAQALAELDAQGR
jgi:hypothetical protein